jgi:hypothetical protein
MEAISGTCLQHSVLRFWQPDALKPDSANLDPNTSGLIVHCAEATSFWDFDRYNNDTEAIRHFLEKENAGLIHIPYRRNRAVIFDSNPSHKTDELHFREGFEKCRINITMLIGNCNSNN